MIYFTKEQVIIMHNNLIKLTGGKQGVKDYNSLDFCIKSSFVTFNNVDLYPTIIDKYATLGFNIITKHPFHDGNKRIGMHLLMLGLKLNNIDVYFSNTDVINLGLNIAKNKTNKPELIKFIKTNISKYL